MVKDPVCGMNVDETKTAYKSDYKNKPYSFCSLSCKRAFDLKPDVIVKRISEQRVPGGSTGRSA
ncbi:MAG: YHS domain-containing protein [Chloroflexi bacterium]|nr:YHS domain-containing protein [Chloroflexota bacterium]